MEADLRCMRQTTDWDSFGGKGGQSIFGTELDGLQVVVSYVDSDKEVAFELGKRYRITVEEVASE